MGDRGVTSYEHSGETTEWEDILVKKGVVSREQVFAAKGLDARDFPTQEERDAAEKALAELVEQSAQKEHPLEHASLEELAQLEDEDVDDDRALQQYREKRLREMKEKAAKERFGDVMEISKADWVAEVTEASKACWVVVHLYQDRVDECRIFDEVLQVVARKFKMVKVVKIRSTSAVENWPDRNLPTLFIYHDGELKHQLLGIKTLGGMSTRPMDLEWYLASLNVVETELEENPRQEGRTMIHRGGACRCCLEGGSEDEEDD